MAVPNLIGNPRGASSWNPRYFAEWIFLIATLLLLGCYVAYSQYQDYLRLEAQERDSLANQVTVMERNLTPQLFAANRAINGILDGLPAWNLGAGGVSQANRHLRLVADTLPGISNILIIDAAGRVQASNTQELIGADISWQEHFQAASRNPNSNTLQVTPPFKTTRDAYVISLYRVISGAGGGFGGIVMAQIAPNSFRTLLDSVRHTPDTITSIVHGDGQLFMMVPERDDLRGKNLALPDTFFSRHRDSGRLESLFAGHTYATGDERMIAFRTVHPAALALDKALVVTASRDYRSVFAPWRRASAIAGGMFAALSLGGILGLHFHQRRQRAHDRIAAGQEKALRASETWFRSIFENTTTAIASTDAEGRIVSFNESFRAMLGYDGETLKHLNFTDLTHPDDRELEILLFNDVLSGARNHYRMTKRYLASRGEILWVDIHVNAIRRQDGAVSNFVGVINDITERLESEAKLRDSELRLRTIVDNEPECIKIIDAGGRLRHMNPAGLAMIEADSIEQVAGRPLLDLVAPEYRRAYVDLHRKVLAGDSMKMEYEVIGLKGGRRWLETHAVPMRDAGETVHLAVSRDITERKQSAADLRVAATAFDSMEGMMVTDANGVILRVNKAFTETTGYSAEEVVGRTPSLLQSGYHDADFYRAMWDCIKRSGTWQGEIWDRRKNGEIYPKWLTISAVKGADGAVTHYVGTQFDITERKKSEERIYELAFYDQLTGLPNRTLLLDRLKQTMTSTRRSGCHGALLFIDLDNFKTLNDTLGHDVGDLLLKEASQRLSGCVREGDTVARLGGDEFVVILADLSANEDDAATSTETIAGKILATLREVYQFGDLPHRSTASIGATLFKGNRISADELMKQADLTMYKAKEAGRNTVCFFDPAMEVAVQARTALESDLRRAVDEGRFVLHFQPQVVDDERVTGAEVLVRWSHPERGSISPAEFIPLAEETGLILPLGRWVLETACRQLSQWAGRAATSHLTLAVNVSASQFGQPGFVDEVLTILKDTGANPKRLKLELTESMLVNNVQEIIEKMFALKAQGVSFALDDFGTGYSSLSYLKRLPLDQLKIDQSFVRDILVDANDAAIARTVVALAQSLGLGVIAEGVETDAQRGFLSRSGCHAYQGYLFSKPLPLDQFEEFLAIDEPVCTA